MTSILNSLLNGYFLLSDFEIRVKYHHVAWNGYARFIHILKGFVPIDFSPFTASFLKVYGYDSRNCSVLQVTWFFQDGLCMSMNFVSSVEHKLWEISVCKPFVFNSVPSPFSCLISFMTILACACCNVDRLSCRMLECSFFGWWNQPCYPLKARSKINENLRLATSWKARLQAFHQEWGKHVSIELSSAAFL